MEEYSSVINAVNPVYGRGEACRQAKRDCRSDLRTGDNCGVYEFARV